MDQARFDIEVEKSILRSKLVLNKKAKVYSKPDGDRLEQFYRAGSAQATTPHRALIGMATKHFTSIADMATAPMKYKIEEWNEKLTDLRNYTILLDALVRDFHERAEEIIKA